VPGRPLTITQVLALLVAAPPRLVTLTAGIAPDQLRATPARDAWSANDVLAHLRACSDVWGGCIATILAEDTPTLRAVNPTTWIETTNYRDLDFRPSLRAFAAQRAKLLMVLDALPPDGWARTATGTGGGSARLRSVLDYAQRLARHERSHLRQIGRIAATLKRS
jgi:hypothetical protein